MTIQYLATLQQAERAIRASATVTVSLPTGIGSDHAKRLVAALVAQHEMVRSRLFTATDGSGRLIQEVSRDAELTWRATGEPGASEGCFVGGPLCVHLLAGDSGQTEVRLSLPSSYVDLGGLAVLAAELSALAAGRALVEPVHNSQYAAWQAANAAQPHVGRPFLPPPDTRPGGTGPRVGVEGSYERQTHHVSGELWAAVRGRARSFGVDVDAVLLAAWLIGQARRGDGPITGVYVDHRRLYEDLRDTVGVLSRYLPFTVGITDDETAENAVRQVAQHFSDAISTLDTFTWSDFPPGAYDCDSRAPALPTLFASLPVRSSEVLDHATLFEPSHAPGLSLQVLYADSGARIDLLSHGRLPGEAPASVVLDTYLAVLADVAHRPGRSIAELRMLSPEAEREVLAHFGRAPEHVPLTDETAYHVIAAQVDRTPDRVAVTDGRRTLTYAQLRARIGLIAGAITNRGLPAGGRVALLMDRTVDMVAAVLGVWRAGMCYVPVDTGMPADRISYILADSGAALLLTDLPDVTSPAIEATTVLRMAQLDAGTISADTVPDGPRNATEPAYVIYTSGTTGRPKGVVVEHRSVVNLARAHRERIYRHHETAGGLRASLNAPLVFDGSVERIMLLASGCTLVVVDDETRRDPAAFIAFADRHQLQVLDVTPSFLTALVAEGLLARSGYSPSVVLVGGEAIGEALWRTLAESPADFYNVYGPTEATVNAAVGLVAGAQPHLGPALANVRLYILDAARQPVLPEVPGEIHVAGVGVAQGYLKRPELTAQAFIQNPFAADEPVFGRMYATGDIGRFNRDGSIAYLGRRDGQVKLRGVRIETGEIASVLSQDPSVTDALVRLADDAPDQRLVAYVVAPEEAHEGLAERLRILLAEQLPAYMLPASIVPLAALPLTVNGKLDVDALPDSTVPHAGSDDFVAPRTRMEAAVARIWSELLERDRISVTDNFLDVGGHSLIAQVMLRRLSEEFGVSLPLRTIFAAATVAELADRVSHELSAG